MSATCRDRWLILAVEGAAIVVSILLAFAIDAWWEERADRKQEAALLIDLHDDFQASQAHLQQWLAGSRVVEQTAMELLEQIRSAQRNELITVRSGLVVGATSIPTYSPTDSSLRAAVSSGQIELMQNDELAKWEQILADTSADEILSREIVVHRLSPALSRQLRPGYLLEFSRRVDLFLGEPNAIDEQMIELRADPELEGALTERLFLTNWVVLGLANLHESQARILDLVKAQIEKSEPIRQ